MAEAALDIALCALWSSPSTLHAVEIGQLQGRGINMSMLLLVVVALLQAFRQCTAVQR
jgi:hypothetical protein